MLLCHRETAHLGPAQNAGLTRAGLVLMALSANPFRPHSRRVAPAAAPLQDAAQYALGNLMAVVLGDARVPPAQRQRHVTRLLEELRRTNTAGQCQGEHRAAPRHAVHVCGRSVPSASSASSKPSGGARSSCCDGQQRKMGLLCLPLSSKWPVASSRQFITSAQASLPLPPAVVLTVLSCMAGNARVRSAMAHCHARRCLMDFGQHIPDPRLRARSLSLIKVRAGMPDAR